MISRHTGPWTTFTGTITWRVLSCWMLKLERARSSATIFPERINVCSEGATPITSLIFVLTLLPVSEASTLSVKDSEQGFTFTVICISFFGWDR